MDTALIQTLKTILKQFPKFWNGENLQRSLVIDAIQKKEADLVKALINNSKIKSIYSTDVDGVLIFDFDKLISLLKYKEYWADSFTKYRNKVGLTSEGKYLDYNSDVVLDFPFKDCVLEGGMTKEEEAKNEIYYNEIIARDEIDRLFSPKVFANTKRYTKAGIEEKCTQFNDKDNLVIKGNNLIALHSLKERYAGKVKLIYIDPPYNTGDDGFKYNDNFNHSTWLTFMKNRLEVAHELLCESGIICIQINDVEFGYLKVLCDGIFKRENFLNSICIQMAHLSGVKMSHISTKIPKIKEHILVYSKNSSNISLNPQYIPVDWDFAFNRYQNFIKKNDSENIDEWTSISLNNALKESGINLENDKEVLEFKINNAHLIFQTAINRSKNYPKEPRNKFLDIEGKYVLNGREVIFASEKIRVINGKKTPTSIISDIWTDIGINNVFQEGGEDISLRFGKKPEMLLKRIIALFSNEGDLVLDFHLGSGTTCAVAHKMKRQYIGIEQLDYIEDLAIKRLNNIIQGDSTGISKEVDWQGGGSFIYTELMELNSIFIHQIEQAQTTENLLGLFEVMKAEAHLNYHIALDQVLNNKYEVDGVDHLVSFTDLEFSHQKQLLIEVLDKNQLYVNASEMDDQRFAIPESDKTFTTSFYQKD
ncbi:site-specific DNA-methyltransferase [Acinetobacter sp. 11520]|nr:site-specific DNA-methyltransferase [Acinetobacter sp. 11520]